MPISSSILARLAHQHETMGELVKGLTEAQVKEHINAGKWSAFENVVHLTAYQPVFLQRLQRIEQQENPLFERYTADDDPAFHQFLNRSLKDLLEDYSTQRFLLNKHLTSLSETVLRRQGSHSVYGRFTTAQWTDFFLLHEAHHFFTIFMLTASLRNRFQQ